MMKNIVIIGAGGFGKEVAWLIEKINTTSREWNILGFLELAENRKLFGEKIYGYPVLGENQWLRRYKREIYVICAIGRSSRRKSVYEEVLKYPNVTLATLIDPNIRIHESVTIGNGSILCNNCCVTVDIHIGEGVVLNTGTSIGHDSNIGDYCTCFVNSIVAGNVNIGECCEIGSGAFVLQKKTIVANSTLAPLSSVLKDIIEPGVYSGNPARRIF